MPHEATGSRLASEQDAIPISPVPAITPVPGGGSAPDS